MRQGHWETGAEAHSDKSTELICHPNKIRTAKCMGYLGYGMPITDYGTITPELYQKKSHESRFFHRPHPQIEYTNLIGG